MHLAIYNSVIIVNGPLAGQNPPPLGPTLAAERCAMSQMIHDMTHRPGHKG